MGGGNQLEVKIMAGRKTIPTNLKILRVNPGKRKLNENEPDPSLSIPKFPSHLSAEAKKEWERISKELFKLGLLSEIDRASLVAYCVLWARWIESERKVKRQGIMLKSKDGKYAYQNPYLSVANKALVQMKSHLIEFGMTPSSRSRISIAGGEEEENPFDQFT